MKNHSFCTKENIQVKYFGICTALLSEEKTFPSVENVLRRRALGRIKHLEQGVFYGVWGGGGGGGGRRGHLYGPASRKKTQKDTTRRENLT